MNEENTSVLTSGGGDMVEEEEEKRRRGVNRALHQRPPTRKLQLSVPLL